jgi:hypothetical protein
MKSASRQKLSSGDKLKDVLKQNRRLGSGGVYSEENPNPRIQGFISSGTAQTLLHSS